MYAVQIYRKVWGDKSPCSGGRKLLLGLCKDGVGCRNEICCLACQAKTQNEMRSEECVERLRRVLG
jgi:hypothetical protein